MAPRAANPHSSRARSSSPKVKRIFSEAIPSATHAVEPVVARVLDVLGESGCMNGQPEGIELALREALANAILHGNQGNPRKRVQVDCFQQDDASIVLVVRDQGRGFDPALLEDPTKSENIYRACGRGIFLIRHFMDEVRFLRGGREIHMRKRP